MQCKYRRTGLGQAHEVFVLSHGEEGRLHGHSGRWVGGVGLEVWGSSFHNLFLVTDKSWSEDVEGVRDLRGEEKVWIDYLGELERAR